MTQRSAVRKGHEHHSLSHHIMKYVCKPGPLDVPIVTCLSSSIATALYLELLMESAVGMTHWEVVLEGKT